MGPKRKTVPKAKIVASDSTEALPDTSGVTFRRKVKDDKVKKLENEELSIENLNSTEIVKNIDDFSKPTETTELEKSDTKLINEQNNIPVKRTVIKGKSKLPKETKEDVNVFKGRLRAASVDRKPTYEVLEKKTEVKSRKRAVGKDVSDESKPTISNKTIKRNRLTRASSVDVLSTEISKTTESTIVVTKGTKQINKKKNVKEIESKLQEQKELNTKPQKKNKQYDEKEEPLLSQQISDDLSDILPQETKSKRRVKKNHINKPDLESPEPITKKPGKTRAAPKIRNTDEIEKEIILKKPHSPCEESDNYNMILESEQNYKEPIKKTGKTRNAPKTKQIDEGKKESIIKKQKSPPRFDRTDDSDDGDIVFKSPDQNYTEPIAKKTGDIKPQYAPEPKLMVELEKEYIIKKEKSPPKSDGHDSGDSDLKLETLEIKPKRGIKKVKSNVETKDAEDKLMDELEKESIIKKQKSPPKSDGHDSGDGNLKLETLEIKPKRGVKKVKSNVEIKDAEDKPKKSKRVKKIKGDNLEDRQNYSPPNGNEVEEVKYKSDVHSDTPESDKTDIKPKIKRKTKAKK